MLTSAALTALKNCIKDNVGYAQYKVGNTYYRAEIQTASVLSDGRVAITFLVEAPSGNITVTEVQLYNHNGVLWASKVENIQRKSSQEAILYRFAFTITES